MNTVLICHSTCQDFNILPLRQNPYYPSPATMRFFPSTLSITLLALNAQSVCHSSPILSMVSCFPHPSKSNTDPTLLHQSLGLPLADDSALKPTSIDCGTTSDDLSPPIYAGIPNVSPPDYTDLRKAAQRLSKKGGTCSTPAGGGNCVRVACDNTTGFWVGLNLH